MYSINGKVSSLSVIAVAPRRLRSSPLTSQRCSSWLLWWFCWLQRLQTLRWFHSDQMGMGPTLMTMKLHDIRSTRFVVYSMGAGDPWLSLLTIQNRSWPPGGKGDGLATLLMPTAKECPAVLQELMTCLGSLEDAKCLGCWFQCFLLCWGPRVLLSISLYGCWCLGGKYWKLVAGISNALKGNCWLSSSNVITWFSVSSLTC